MTPRAPLELTYLGCEGVLLRSSTGCVMIDGLYSDEAEPFGVPPPSARETLRRARPPFDGVDVILATHHHADHFAADAVAAFLEAAPGARFVSTRQAAASMVAATGGAFADRTHALDAGQDARTDLEIGAVHIEAFALSHGRVHYADVEHLGFAVTLDGYRVLHLGDGIVDEKALRAAGVLEDPGDVGVVPFWYLTYPFGQRLVSRGFRPRALFAVHIRQAEHGQVKESIESWIEAVALTDPLSRYRVADDGSVIREE